MNNVNILLKITFSGGRANREQPTEPLLIITSRKFSEIVAALILLLIWTALVKMFMDGGRGSEYIIFFALTTVGLLYNLQLLTRKLVLYENAIERKQLFANSLFYLEEGDSLELFLLANPLSKKKSLKYRLIKKNRFVCQLDTRDYKDLSRIEQIYGKENPCVKEVSRSQRF